MDRIRLPSPPVLGWGALAAACALSFVLVAARVHGDMSIIGDEWRYAYWLSTDGFLEKGFDPADGKYAIPVPFFIYQGLFEVFGADSYVPFRLAMCVFIAIVACLSYEFMRRRLGYGLALPLAAIIPLFGAAGEVVVNSFRMPGMISLAASLGAILAIDGERSTRRDMLAAALLVIAIASHPLALAFVVAVAILRLGSFVKGRHRLATIGIVAGPLLAFLTVLRPVDKGGEPVTSRLDEIPSFTSEGVQGTLAALGGFVSEHVIPFDSLTGFGSPYGIVAAIVLVLAVAWALWVRGIVASLPVLALLAAALIILTAPILAPSERVPNLGRYLFPAGVCMLLATSHLASGLPEWLRRGQNVHRAVAVGLAVLAATAIAGNISRLNQSAAKFGSDSQKVRAEMAALESVRDLDHNPRAIVDHRNNAELLGGHFRFPLRVEEYYRVADDYGTTAWTPSELAEQDPDVRRVFDVARELALGKVAP